MDIANLVQPPPQNSSRRRTTGSDMQNQRRKLRRTANACIPCRQSKIKCSGQEPCNNCQRRFVNCRFEGSGGVPGNNKVVVSERYLYELQRGHRARATHQQSLSDTISSPAGATAGSAEGLSERQVSDLGLAEDLPPLRRIDDTRSIWTSPFLEPSITIQNTQQNQRKWIWLAPSSTWSFTTRLALMISQKLNCEGPSPPPSLSSEDVYPPLWCPPPTQGVPDVSALPSLNHALYLFNTAKFHLGQNYHFFDEAEFVHRMRDFYSGDTQQKAIENRLWFVQFLLVLAFGNAFLLRSNNADQSPGSRFFMRAMSLLPNIASLWKDSLLAIEVLALAGLYLYSVDQRESAHVYVGQAIRIAQLEGLHTQLPESQLGSQTVSRCRRLWWTLYILDQHFSSSLGLPMSTQDSDVVDLLDTLEMLSHSGSTLGLHVRLSREFNQIFTSIYRTGRTELTPFLETTRMILHSMAAHAQEIEHIIQESQNPIEVMSKETRHITLLYHQCVIFATRPLLLSVLKERLERLGQEEEDWQNFLALTKPLISTGIKSAVKTIQILTAEDGLLEVFLPFDLEFGYCAAIHLAMANALFPSADDLPSSYSPEIHAILDDMISRGNRVAHTRKAQLSHLEVLFNELAQCAKRKGLQTLTLATPEGDIIPASHLHQHQGHGQQQENGLLPVGLPEHGTDLMPPDELRHLEFGPPPLNLEPMNNDLLDSIGISSCEFLSIVGQLGDSNHLYDTLEPDMT